MGVTQELNSALDLGHSRAGGSAVKATWEQVEGSPLPLGATWIAEERAFNFAICSEQAESVTLLL